MLRTIAFLALSQVAIAQHLACSAAAGSALTAQWCTDNCNHNPPFCPSDCTCAPVFVNQPGCSIVGSNNRGLYLPWCLDNCYHNPRFCPTTLCDCSEDLPFSNPLIHAFFLSGSQEVPPTGSTNTGSCFTWFTNNRGNIVVRCVHTVSDLIAAHVHNGVFGVNGPIVHPFTPTFPNLNQNSPVTPTTVQKWINGEFYTNVHNPTNPGGNIRGQIARVANIGVTYYNFFLTAADATANGLVGLTDRSGSCAAAVRQNPNNAANFDFIIACLHNIPAATVTAATIGGGAGSTLLSFTLSATLPFIEGRFTVSAAANAEILAGNWFLRLDTAAGSVRGQIVDATRFQYPVVNA